MNPSLAIFGGYLNEGFSNELFIFDLLDMRWYAPIPLYNTHNDMPTPRQGSSLVYG